MSERAPKPDMPITPEKEARQARYRANLENLSQVDLAAVYPPELQHRTWTEVTDAQEVAAARNQLVAALAGELPPATYGLFRDESGTHTYLVYRHPKFPQLRQVKLDTLAAVQEIAPWARPRGMAWMPDDAMLGEVPHGHYIFQHGIVRHNWRVQEYLVNGLADPQYSDADKQGFLRQDIAVLVHESTHMANTDSIDFGGPHRTVSEVAPMAAEYLAFPGKNAKMKTVTAGARQLLRGEQEKDDYYRDATLLGMLVMANDEGLLPVEEDIEKIDAGLAVWQEKIENVSPEELAAYRRTVEAEWLLSERDHKLHGKLHELKQQYPALLQRLLGDYELSGEEK